MLRLLYDLTAAQPSPESKFHGGGEYCEVVFFKLLEYVDRVSLHAVYDAAAYINPLIPRLCAEKGVPLLDIRSMPVAEMIRSLHIERVYSAMLNLNHGWPLGSVPVYATVHGLRTIEMPFDSTMLAYARTCSEKLKNLLAMGPARRLFLKKLTAINGRLVTDERINVITISRHSKASMLSFFPELRNRRIPVFYSPTFAQLDGFGALPAGRPLQDLHALGLEEKTYFLLTSAARWVKNSLRAACALDRFFSKGFAPGYKAVLTGVTRESLYRSRIKNADKFVFLDYVERDMLELLVHHAYCFVYPSLNEGFGYPPLDAMRHGVPVAASGTSSIPEVCGDAALYFDPYSLSEMQNRFVQLMDPGLYKSLAERGRERYALVSARQKADLQALADYITG